MARLLVKQERRGAFHGSLVTSSEVLANELESKLLTHIGYSWFSGHGFGRFPGKVRKGATANLLNDRCKKARIRAATQPGSERTRIITCREPSEELRQRSAEKRTRKEGSKQTRTTKNTRMIKCGEPREGLLEAEKRRRIKGRK